MSFSKLTASFETRRLATATLAGDRLLLVRHDDLAAVRVDGDAVTPWMAKVGARETRSFFGGHLDDRYLHVAADPEGNVWILDKEGAITRRAPDGALTRISPADPRAAGHYAHRVGFAWDALGRRLVLVGGPSRNDTHVLDEGAQALRSLSGPGPTHGLGRAVGSPLGVYYVVDDEIWLLEGDRWSLVDELEGYEFARPIPWVDEANERLLVVTRARHDAPERLVARSTAGTVELIASLPRELLDDHEACMGFDPITRRMILASGKQMFAATVPDAEVSQRGWPRTPRATRPIVVDPPISWFRESLAIDADRTQPAVELPASIVPDGMIVLGIFPESPFLPIAGKSLVLLASDRPYEGAWHELSFDNPFEVVISDEPLPPCLPAVNESVLRPLVVGPRFREVDPAYVERIDSLTGGEPYRSTRSKIGGFPFLLQGGVEEAASALFENVRCTRCSAYLRFALQINEHLSALSGVLYVYVCPLGCSGAAYVQSS